ncbi:MAG: phosphoribosylanthranilate isomerase [Halanaerobium sp.]
MNYKRTMVKVCGLTCREDIDFAVELGVDGLGFILAKSARKVELETVKELSHNLPPFIDIIAVVVNPQPKKIEEIIESGLFNYIQLHGSEDPEMIKKIPLKTIKAISIEGAEDLKKIAKYQTAADFLLFDTKIGSQIGGTGQSFDWSLIEDSGQNNNYILAGGLGADNIELALKELAPAAVDINSQVESSPGKKDHKLLKETVEIIKNFNFDS